MSGDLLEIERSLWRDGLVRVVGVDEVGRGPLAGPVAAAAVIWYPQVPPGPVRDSKAMTERQRDEAFAYVHRLCRSWAVAVIDADEIDRTNILQASLRAMALAVARLRTTPDRVLVDGNRPIPGLRVPQQTLVKGDARSVSIAAASIMAKVVRDRMMLAFDMEFPGYGFSSHKGYGSAAHLAAIKELGPSPIHRLSFAPLSNRTQGRLDLDA